MMNREIIIPIYVGEWIKENKYDSWWKIIAKWEKEVSEKDRETYNWYSDGNENLFILAWITGEYAVKKEEEFFVEFPNVSSGEKNKYLLCASQNSEAYGIDFSSSSFVKNNLETYLFTEREIKAIDERYLAFKVPVSEVL